MIFLEESKKCNWFIEQFGDEKRIVFDCEECLENALFSNSKCRKGVVDALKISHADYVILKKSFQRCYDKNSIENLKKLMKISEEIESEVLKLNFCKDCKKIISKYNSFVDDPIKFSYIFEESNPCDLCKKINKSILEKIKNILESKIIKKAIKLGNIKIFYNQFFKPKMIPSLITSNINLEQPKTKKIDEYKNGNIKIEIYNSENRLDNIYFIRYPEFELNNKELNIINEVFKDVCNAKIIDTKISEVRKEFRKIIEESLSRKIEENKLSIKEEEKEKLIDIILRHTIGYGLLEPLLSDELLQDIYIDSGSRLVHLVHSRHGECITNIWLSKADVEKIATRLRAVSGRPFDSSSPVLHTELQEFGIRVAAITEPSTYQGVGFAFRRRKSSPWTLPEFIKYNMITPEAAGLLSFLLDGNCSILVVGPRGSGKTSLLTSLMLEINQNNRIIVIEDTPEVPVDNLRELGYKIEHLKTEAFAKGYELSAEDALRTSLRLGESILIIGEVRGPEAKALFEAMRIGAVGNIVMGTIHGSGPYDVWDRITNDLGVPSTSFKATDIIITTGIIRKGDDIRRYRRVLGITEVRKNWRDEPIFYDLMKYDRNKDKLILCDLKKSETIKKIATMKGFSINQAIKNIQLRSYIKKRIFEMHKKHPQILNAKNIINANNLFLKLSTENKDIKKEFEKYFKQYLVEQYG